MELKVTSFSKEKFLENVQKQLLSHNIISEDIAFLIEKGYSPKEIQLYGLNRSNYSHYFRDSLRYQVTVKTNTGYWPILHDKMLFYNFIKDYLPTPKLFATIFYGSIRWQAEEFSSVDEIYQSAQDFVVKPLQGGEGQGIYFLRKMGLKVFLQGEEIEQSNLQGFLAGLHKYGVFQYVNQHSSLCQIYSESVNTIRLLGMRDRENDQAYIFAAVLRMGWEKSKPLDNFSQGGLVALIDLETGTLSEWKTQAENGDLISGSIHPNSGFIVEGFTIPHWDKIKHEMQQFLNSAIFFDCVGWDIIVTENGYSVLEGNHNPGLYTMQIFKGFFSDHRNLSLYKKLEIYE